jgi:hypothetical protein
MDDAGYSAESQLALDDSYLGFVQQFERLQQATVLIDAPPRDKHAKPQIEVPAHDEDFLKAYLDIPSGKDAESAIAENAINPVLMDHLWKQVPWETPPESPAPDADAETEGD